MSDGQAPMLPGNPGKARKCPDNFGIFAHVPLYLPRLHAGLAGLRREFPAATLYRVITSGNNQIKNFKKAFEILESGYDFVIDNYSLEINFNIQLGEASHGIGDSLKKEKYFSKANELIKKHNK